MCDAFILDRATLTKLDISHNCIGDDGILIVSEELQQNSTLTMLRMIDCGFTAKGDHNDIYVSNYYYCLHVYPKVINYKHKMSL